MSRNGLLVGEVVRRSGASRKALRLWEAAGILPSPRRTPSGYRLYDATALDLLAFVRRAQGLGFTLDEIKEIVEIRRAGNRPCPHVRELVRRKAATLDRRLADLVAVRDGLRALLKGWREVPGGAAVVCPHIEQSRTARRHRPASNGQLEKRRRR
jgi:DNA-binding transcriptional MerR regulator